MESHAVKARLESVRPQVEELMAIGGTPGAAIAILHEGTLLHSEFIGFRDTTAKLPVDTETIFPCASLTKAVVSAAVALCVEAQDFDWDTPVKDIIPEFTTQSEILHHNMTPVDCLSHRAGMQSSLYWLGSQNNVLISKDKSMDFINDLKQVRDFRDGYLYNNLGYEIAAHILEAATAMPWDRFMHLRIFEPLGMSRTRTSHASLIGIDNVAKTYQALDDSSTVEVTPMLSGADTVGGPGSAMRSCIKDLVSLYSCFLETAAHQYLCDTTRSIFSPLCQVPYLFSPKISMKTITARETSYALGWARVQTPGPMGAIGLNPGLMYPQPMPLVGRDHESHLILYHQGCMPGNLAAVNLIPATKGAIIVLTNSLALNDVADWIGQLCLEAYLGVRNRNDFVALARKSAAAAREWYPRLQAQLREGQTLGTSPRNLSEYAGQFRNKAGTMMIEVVCFPSSPDSQSSLRMRFQGLDSEEFTLTHYQDDTFTWLLPRDEFARKARFTSYGMNYFKISFEANVAKENIDSLLWRHDAILAEPERFGKVG